MNLNGSRSGDQSVLSACDDVEMREQHERLPRAAAVIANDEIEFVGLRAAEEHVAVGKAGVAKAFRDGVRRDRRAADGVGGVDLDHFFVDVVRELLVPASAHCAESRTGNASVAMDATGETHQKSLDRGCVKVAARAGVSQRLSPARAS